MYGGKKEKVPTLISLIGFPPSIPKIGFFVIFFASEGFLFQLSYFQPQRRKLFPVFLSILD